MYWVSHYYKYKGRNLKIWRNWEISSSILFYRSVTEGQKGEII